MRTYLSDISGAFDKVFKPYLLAKLQRAGVGEIYLKFLDSYLAPRYGQVLVQGSASERFPIDDSVYQGTVLGPPLWNTFFADVNDAARSSGGSEEMFADDLSVFQIFDLDQPTAECEAILNKCKTNVHKWGKTNRVSFDASKEHTIILHPSAHHGETFKLLGCPVDTDLRAHSAVAQVLSKIRPKVTAILRSRGYYDVPGLIMQFKAHVWGIIESHIGGYVHAASTLLDNMDGVQRRFLRELDLIPEQAFLEFNFAPPSLRRHIAGVPETRILCKPATHMVRNWYARLVYMICRG